MALLRWAKDAQSDFFPGFVDVSEIGMGSLSTVYRAREVGTDRQVALKLLNVGDASPRAIESFERESVALGAVSSHPNIVTLYRSFRAADGRPVLVLELCRGSIADSIVNGQGLPVADVVAMGIKIAGALETAHRAGILHRDVKPQNILITEYGEPALASFGVAMLQSSTQTTAGLFDFTTLHAAPELLEGGDTSEATDVYELASTLYQLATGKSAFRAYDGDSPASVILRILRDPVQPLASADFPTQLSDLLLRAMSKDKTQRPPTAREFAAELAAVETDQGWPRTPFLIRDAHGTPVDLPSAGVPAAGVPAVGRMPQPPLPAAPQLPSAQRPASGGMDDPARSPWQTASTTQWGAATESAPRPATPVPPRPATPRPPSPRGAPTQPGAVASAAAPESTAAPGPLPPAPAPEGFGPPEPGAPAEDEWTPAVLVQRGPNEPGPQPPPVESPRAEPPPAEPPPPVWSPPVEQSPAVQPVQQPAQATGSAVEREAIRIDDEDDDWSTPRVVTHVEAAAEPESPAPTATSEAGPWSQPEPASVDPPPAVSPGIAPETPAPIPVSWEPPETAPEDDAAPTVNRQSLAPVADVPEPDAPMPAPSRPAPFARRDAGQSPPAPPEDAGPTPEGSGGPASVDVGAFAPESSDDAPPVAPAPAPIRQAGQSGPQPGVARSFPLPPTGPADQPPELVDHSIAQVTGTTEVPTWAFRSPSTTGMISLPQGGFAPGAAAGPPGAETGDLTLDPMSLRRRVTIRSGPRVLVVDEQRVVLRAWGKKTELRWPEIHGFELRPDGAGASGSGRIIALTSGGPVELPATRRAVSDLRYVHELLEAYRIRARMTAGS